MTTDRRGLGDWAAIARAIPSAAATPAALSVAPLQIVSSLDLYWHELPRWS
jgi:hypothetical protein